MPVNDCELHGDIAVIRLDNPPMNTLSHALRARVHAQLERAAQDAAVKAAVMIGAGRAFCAGAEIREFNTPASLASPMTPALVAAAERFPKPLVAAINGVAMGGGLELALGCHYRAAVRGAPLAFPEVKLGLLPGASGTQRLPRALGVERALEFILTGRTAKAEEFAGTVMVDELLEGDALAGALAFARRLLAEGRGPRRLSELPAALENAQAFFSAKRAEIARSQRGYTAPRKCIDALEAATRLPFEEGVRFERRCFEELVAGTESKALRHAFLGERAVAKIPDVPEDTPVLEVRSAAILGAGTMGSGIAMAFADNGFAVKLFEVSAEALARGLAAIRGNYAGAVARGRLAQGEMDARLARIEGTLALEDLAASDLAIEAVFEDMAVKKDVFRRLDAVMKPGAILASNTSGLDLDEIAAATRRPQDVVGMHFFSPANVMRLVEVVRGRETSKPVLATAMRLARNLKKLAVLARVCDGFIGNRMADYYLRQAEYLLDEGAAPQAVDKALVDWGMAMGPFAMCDLVGMDIVQHMRARRRAALPQLRYSRIPDVLFERARLGHKSGAGYYRYEKGSREALPDPAADELIAAARREAGTAPRAIGAAEIVERCVYALVNEGARILEEGVALRAVDIDMVYLAGYGFPPYRGGPMFFADSIGLAHVVAGMKRFASGYRGEVWKAAALLEKLASEGGRFNA